MFCPKCGNQIPNGSEFCPACKCNIDRFVALQNGKLNTTAANDDKSFLISFISFLAPMFGLILYVIDKEKFPKRAKSAAKGAAIGLVVWITVSIISTVVSFAAFFRFNKFILGEDVADKFKNEIVSEFKNNYDDAVNDNDITIDRTDDVEIKLEQFKINDSDSENHTLLEVYIKNLDDETKTFVITIEAVDESGKVIEKNTVTASNLGAQQTTKINAFTVVNPDNIESLKTAQFKVSNITEQDD